MSLEIPVAFARVSKAVLLTKIEQGEDVDLTKVELKLRERLELKQDEVPLPFQDLIDTSKAGKHQKGQGQSANSAIQPDALPALRFQDGQVMSDAASLARAKNLEIGGRVTAIRNVRGIKKGAEGHLLALDKEAMVR